MLSSLNISPCKGWPGLETMETIPRILIDLNKVTEPSGFETWMIIERGTHLIIGDIGFKGIPNKKGEIDLGYGLTESERKKGFALEAAIGIIHWAFNQKNVKAITASCLIENLGSRKILSLLNFSIVKTDLEMIYWIRNKETKKA